TGGVSCYSEGKVCKLIVSSLVLHNFCVLKEIPLTEEDERCRDYTVIPIYEDHPIDQLNAGQFSAHASQLLSGQCSLQWNINAFLSFSPKKKSECFSDEEKTTLINLYSEYCNILQGTFSDSDGARLKKRKWNDILDAGTKKQSGKLVGGSDEEDELEPDEEKLLSTISKRSIYGVPGGIDTGEIKTEIRHAANDCKKPKICGTDHKGTDQPESCIATISSSMVLFDPDTIEINEEVEMYVTSDNEVIVKQRRTITPPISTPRPTPSSSKVTSARRELFANRKSAFSDGPQTKLMREQVDRLEQQVGTFKRIEQVLQEMKDIEQKKLGIMEASLTLSYMKFVAKAKKAEIGLD
ncbi:hypothetical protein Fcan01_26160, partial [Folsomia candida]